MNRQVSKGATESAVQPGAASLLVRLLTPGELEPGLELLAAPLPGADHTATADSWRQQFDLRPSLAQGLLGGFRGEQLVGVILVEILGGGAVSIGVPRLLAREPVETAVAMIHHAAQFAGDSSANFAQAALEQQQTEAGAWFRAAGFRWIAELVYLYCDLRRPRTDALAIAAHRWNETGLRLVSYTADAYDRLSAVIEATYTDTLDCPDLNGQRATDDVLQNYAAVGDSGSALWHLITDGAMAVGCLLLAKHNASAVAELVYMGLIPSARGRGWGRAIVQQAIKQARQLDCQILSAAGDAKNAPALRAYQQCHFIELTRRDVLLRKLD